MKDLKHIELANGVLKVGDSVEYCPIPNESTIRSTIIDVFHSEGSARLHGYMRTFPLNCLKKVY